MSDTAVHQGLEIVESQRSAVIHRWACRALEHVRSRSGRFAVSLKAASVSVWEMDIQSTWREPPSKQRHSDLTGENYITLPQIIRSTFFFAVGILYQKAPKMWLNSRQLLGTVGGEARDTWQMDRRGKMYKLKVYQITWILSHMWEWEDPINFSRQTSQESCLYSFAFCWWQVVAHCCRVQDAEA